MDAGTFWDVWKMEVARRGEGHYQRGDHGRHDGAGQSAAIPDHAGGDDLTITKHGVPVAVLVPPPGKRGRNASEIIEELKELRKGVRLGDDLTIRDLAEEGRR